MSRIQTAFILLAAGSGTRFDGDKLTYPINGVPMLSRALQLYGSDRFSPFLSDRIVVLHSQRTEYIKQAKSLGFRVVFNDAPERGISESIRLGLAAALEKKADGFLFSVSDQPYLTELTILNLLSAFFTAPDRIIAPASERGHGNPVIFPAFLATELMELSGNCGGNRVIRNHLNLLTTIPTNPNELKDFDRQPEE